MLHQMHVAYQHDGESCPLGAISYGEKDSSPWTSVCILTSVLTNTAQLAQRIPGQPGRHSTGCVHSLTGQRKVFFFSNEQETCDCGIRQTMQHLLVCLMMDTACFPHDLTMANGFAIAVPGIGRTQFDGHTFADLVEGQ